MQSDAEFRDALIKLIWEWFEPEHAADEVTQRYVDDKIMPLIRVRVAEETERCANICDIHGHKGMANAIRETLP